MEREPIEIALPDGAIENAVLCVTQYIAPDGNMGYHVFMRGDVPLSTILGLAELAKFNLLRENEET